MGYCGYDYHRRKSVSKTKKIIGEPKESSLRDMYPLLDKPVKGTYQR